MSNVTYNAIGYAAQTASAPLAPMQFNRRAPRPDDVAIEVQKDLFALRHNVLAQMAKNYRRLD